MTPAQCAEWIGSDEGVMQAEHDILHADLCEWLGVESLSLKAARGETLTPDEHKLAELEEHAVLAVQRFRAHWRKRFEPVRFGYVAGQGHPADYRTAAGVGV